MVNFMKEESGQLQCLIKIVYQNIWFKKTTNVLSGTESENFCWRDVLHAIAKLSFLLQGARRNLENSVLREALSEDALDHHANLLCINYWLDAASAVSSR